MKKILMYLVCIVVTIGLGGMWGNLPGDVISLTITVLLTWWNLKIIKELMSRVTA